MAQYLYRNPKTGEVKEITQKMSDTHEYSENGERWDRIFTLPQMSIDTQIDPFSEKKFVEKTAGMKTYGECWNASAEFSKKREEKVGKDTVKENYFKKYSKERKGRKHLTLDV